MALLFVPSSGAFSDWTLGENRACVVPGGGRHMRQPAIPKLSKLNTAGRAELLAIWTATLGKPPAALRTSRELLASALAWQLQERKFGGLRPATQRKLRVLPRAQERKRPSITLPQPINLRPGTVINKQWRGGHHPVPGSPAGF